MGNIFGCCKRPETIDVEDAKCSCFGYETWSCPSSCCLFHIYIKNKGKIKDSTTEF